MPLWDSRSDRGDAMSKIKYLSRQMVIGESKDKGDWGVEGTGLSFKRDCRNSFIEEVTV